MGRPTKDDVDSKWPTKLVAWITHRSSSHSNQETISSVTEKNTQKVTNSLSGSLRSLSFYWFVGHGWRPMHSPPIEPAKGLHDTKAEVATKHFFLIILLFHLLVIAFVFILYIFYVTFCRGME